MNNNLKLLLLAVTFWAIYSIVKFMLNRKYAWVDMLQGMPKVGMLILVCVMGLAIPGEFQNFQDQVKEFGAIGDRERKQLIHGQPYLLALDIKKYTDKYYKSDIITDMDLFRNPGMTLHRKLAYFLYPDVDIRGVSPERKHRAIIYFHKANAQSFVPPDYKILKKFNDGVLIAVKE